MATRTRKTSAAKAKDVTTMDVPALDLSQADSGGFEALENGTYPATVFKCDWRKTKGGGVLPADTPMINVQFRIDVAEGEQYYNRRVFRSYIIAPVKKADGTVNDNKSKSDGILAKFFEDIGYPQDTVKSGDFQINFEDMEGRKLRVVVKKKLKHDYEPIEGKEPETDDYDNDVTGTKPPLEDEGGVQ